MAWTRLTFGVGVSAFGATLATWVDQKAGPIFVAAFEPLSLVSTATTLWVFRGARVPEKRDRKKSTLKF